jgi:hypothetical protein
MSAHLGIDASSPFAQVIGTVTQRLGKPAWIGRYLYQIAGVSAGLAAAEVAEIHAAGLALLLIANDTSAVGVAGSYQDGTASGQRALAAARALGTPSGIAISVDWEANMAPSAAWAHGFMDAISAGGCTACFYLNPNIPAHAAAYQGARAAGGRAIYWSSEPEWTAWFDTVRTEFTPALIPGYEADALFHQYSENNLGGIVDLDVASDAGLALLWHPAPVVPPPLPPTPPTYRTNARVALKTAPSHASPIAIDENHRPVLLELGAVVLPDFTAHRANGDEWSAVRLPNSPVHGYLLRSSIVEDAV